MSKFDKNKIYGLLDDFSGRAYQIDRILSKDDKLQEQEIDTLNRLYGKRKEIIENLEKILNSEEGSIFLKENQNDWQSKINPVLELDKRNLDKLNSRVKEIGGDLKQLNKQKSVLIYTKEK